MSDKEGKSSAITEPLYWYQEYWMKALYREGIQRYLRLRETNPPRKYTDEYGESMAEGNCEYFYWEAPPVDPLNAFMLDSYDFRLFGMICKDPPTYAPVVELRRVVGENLLDLRLHAARDFKYGDAIMFLSELEETSGRFILGGTYARKEYWKERCNVYLTKNRSLRCMRNIRNGEEIVRWIQQDEMTEHLETIDQVVVSADKMMLGRIGSEICSEGKFVHFSDNSMELADSSCMLVDKNKPMMPIL